MAANKSTYDYVLQARPSLTSPSQDKLSAVHLSIYNEKKIQFFFKPEAHNWVNPPILFTGTVLRSCVIL